MKNRITLLVLLTLLVSIGYTQAIFDAGIHTAVPFGDVSSPVAEGVQNIIDQDPMTKFLDFNELDGIGFEVDLLGVSAVATVLGITTANDAPERDPMNYEIYGSTNGVDFVLVASGGIPCVTDRFLARTVAFSNTNAYSYYRLNFLNSCSPSSIFQIADVQLFSVVGSAPEMICPDGIVEINDDGVCGSVVEFDILVEDEEDGELFATLITGFDTGEVFPVGITPVVYSVVDSDMNIVSCDFNVEVQDLEEPMILCPDDITLTVASGETEIEYVYEIEVIDNCSPINPIENFIPLGTIDEKSYHVSNTFFTPLDAFFDAEDEDGFLGTIRNETDNNYIQSAIYRYIGNFEIIIGYNDLETEGEFTWHSGDPSTYTNWNQDEPNDGGVNGEDFAIIQSNGGWNDVADADNEFPYLLEVDYAPEQLAGLSSGEMFPLGETVNTFLGLDRGGNSKTCSFTVTVTDVLNVESELLKNGVSLSPNPASDILTIYNQSGLQLEELQVYSADGRLLYNEVIMHSETSYELDVSTFHSGIYTLHILSKEGLAVEKFIVR